MLLVESSPMREEANVFGVIGLIFASLGVFYCAIKLMHSFAERFSMLLSLLCFVAFSTTDGLYRFWVMSFSSTYGDRALEYAFSRLLLLTLLSRFLYSYTPPTEYQAPMHEISTKSSYFILVFIGMIWGIEECLPHEVPAEPFIGLVVTWLFLAFKFRRTARSRLAISLFTVFLLVASVLMAKSAQVTGFDAMGGFLNVFRFILMDYVLRRGDFKLIWMPGAVATAITLLAYLLFQPAHVNHERGILDCLGAAGLGTLFSLGTLLSAIDVMKTNSLLTLLSASCLAEVLMRCLFVPLAQLPVSFPVILALNITGFVLTLFSFLLVVRCDPFASSLTLANLFKFLEEEEDSLVAVEEEDFGVDEEQA